MESVFGGSQRIIMRKQTIWNEKRKLGIIGEESAKIRTIH